MNKRREFVFFVLFLLACCVPQVYAGDFESPGSSSTIHVSTAMASSDDVVRQYIEKHSTISFEEDKNPIKRDWPMALLVAFLAVLAGIAF